jgi:cytidine deaminase
MEKKEILSLIEEAIEARKGAYTPYSNFKVGALVIDEKGRHFKGCNIENASYGLSNCGERTAIFKAISEGMKKINTIVVVADTKGPVSPCGACRQVINEFADKDTIIILANMKKEYEIWNMEKLLPYGFGPSDLD